MPRARGLLPCLWPYGLEPREGALGPGWVRWEQFTLRAIGSLVPVFRHSVGTSQRWWNRAGWAHHRGAYLAGAPGRADALLRDCAGLRGCGRLSLCTHPSFNVRLARLSLMSLLYISKRDAGAFPRQALNIGAAPGPHGQNTARVERVVADLADCVPALRHADAIIASCSPIFLLTCALCFGSVS